MTFQVIYSYLILISWFECINSDSYIYFSQVKNLLMSWTEMFLSQNREHQNECKPAVVSWPSPGTCSLYGVKHIVTCLKSSLVLNMRKATVVFTKLTLRRLIFAKNWMTYDRPYTKNTEKKKNR